MAKTKKTKTQKDNTQKKDSEEVKTPGFDSLPKDVQENLKKIKEKLDIFKDKCLEKFDKYISGIALLPPPNPKEGEKVNKDQINILVLVDDSDSTKMSKEELKSKLTAIIDNIAQEIDKNIMPQTIILSELWQSCYDGKYDLLQLMALAAPIFDRGMLAAIKISEVHKSMVLKKFEKYIVSYVLAGSLVQGKATKDSDIDVFIVIDDTDVKKMTRAELKDKLRAIIIGMGIEAGEMTGIKNKINIQVYILTDFWDSIKEANPVIFTFLRDGVPFYDRGTFMPWKHLLKMGKVKPSMEAIDMYMSSGDQMLKRAHWKIKDIGMEDTFWAILTPSQAALMIFGLPPPTPKETPMLMREIFVKKEKLLDEKWVKILEKNIQIRKDLEHGTKKDISGKEVDELLKNAEDYLEKIKELFEKIEKRKQQESIVHIYDTVVTITRDVLRLEGIDKVNESELAGIVKKELVSFGKMPENVLRILNTIIKAKKDYDSGKLTKPEVEKTKTDSSQYIKFMIEHIQRKRGRELERAKIRVKHGETYGEVIILNKDAFIIHNIDEKEKRISKATVKEDGSLGTITDSNYEEFEKHIAKVEIPSRIFIKEKTFEDLKRVFGKDVEILVNY